MSDEGEQQKKAMIEIVKMFVQGTIALLVIGGIMVIVRKYWIIITALLIILSQL